MARDGLDQATYQEVVIVIVVGAFTAVVLLFVDRWRKTLSGKRKKRLIKNVEMRTFSGKQVCDTMLTRVRDGVQSCTARWASFMHSKPLGARQRGWASPGELDFYSDGFEGYRRYKNLVSLHLSQTIGAHPLSHVRRPAEGHRFSDKEQQMMFEIARKYEVATYGQREFSRREFREILRLPAFQWPKKESRTTTNPAAEGSTQPISERNPPHTQENPPLIPSEIPGRSEETTHSTVVDVHALSPKMKHKILAWRKTAQAPQQ
eukprot:TRINITY_DN14171_c0_g1_i2.p1 TRINITY_DN14171_c0_g1~~TRINITY_DN14171_c0_g1_i2.p1  ORF type:complete len:262 (+),score=45.03 TRINITY_DN14171_c0_g1_i2:294-1079(+)